MEMWSAQSSQDQIHMPPTQHVSPEKSCGTFRLLSVALHLSGEWGVVTLSSFNFTGELINGHHRPEEMLVWFEWTAQRVFWGIRTNDKKKEAVTLIVKRKIKLQFQVCIWRVRTQLWLICNLMSEHRSRLKQG